MLTNMNSTHTKAIHLNESIIYFTVYTLVQMAFGVFPDEARKIQNSLLYVKSTDFPLEGNN